MPRILSILVIIFLNQVVLSQDIRIFHGNKSESVFLKQSDKLENVPRESVKIVRGTDGIITISIVNPNPFFYTYEIKTEDVAIVDDYSNQFSDLVKLLSSLPDFPVEVKNASVPGTQRAIAARAGVPVVIPPSPGFEDYSAVLVELDKQIKQANSFIETSDNPETVQEAFGRIVNSHGFGFRAAVYNIGTLPSKKGSFRSLTLEKDLNNMLEAAITDGSFDSKLNIGGNATLLQLFKLAFQGLNSKLAGTVTQIRDLTKKDGVVRFQVPVKENKKTIVRLIIKKRTTDAEVVRETFDEEIATILPLYVRKRFEVVPVVNLIFQSNRQKFSVENNLVKSTPDDDAKFNIGAMALMNFASFGEFKEYGVGIGIGYSIQPDGTSSSFFAIPSLSYKSIFRVGFGFGYNLSPVGLKNGAAVDAPLPPNITNIEDVVDYKRKPAAVLSIAISGFKF